MKRDTYFLLFFLCVLAPLTLSACGNNEEEERAAQAKTNQGMPYTKLEAQFLWPAFERFWSRGPGVGGAYGSGPFKLTQPTKTAQGYTVNFGHGVRLVVPTTSEDIITGVEAHYAAKPQFYSGGPHFLKLIQHMLSIGTYKWHPNVLEQIHQFYSSMTPAKKEFRHKGTHFIRERVEDMWIFTMNFVPYDEKVWTRPEIQQ